MERTETLKLPEAMVAYAIGLGVYDVPRMISDCLGINSTGRICWPIGYEPAQ